MAETKTRASSKRSRGSQKSSGRSRGSSSKSRQRTSSKTSRAKSNTRASNSGAKSSSRAKGRSSSNGARRVDSARQAVEHGAKDAGQAVGRAASRARVPLMAGGAALAGAAGGLALGMRQSGHGKGIVGSRRPQVKVSSRDLTRVAKEVGTFGAQMGHLANELQRSREENGGKHRSPLEVVIEGLTARR